MAKLFDKKTDAVKACENDPRTRKYLVPKRIVYTAGDVGSVENMLIAKPSQISFSEEGLCSLKNTKGSEHAAVLVDFGREFSGSLRIFIRSVRSESKRANILVRFGESVSEALTPITVKNTTNDHANRDQIINVGFYSANETNESGYRFAYLELLDDECEITLKALQGVFIFRDLDYIGSFECSDEQLNRIWETSAYTVHLCMQEYIWDGIKRDRLVWIGDMHPEVMTVHTVFGDQQLIRDTIDFVRDETPAGKAMNTIYAYTMWWVMIHYELYRYTGNIEYLKEQREYLKVVLKKMIDHSDAVGVEIMANKSLLDWPTQANTVAREAGIHGLIKMTLDAGAELLSALGEGEMALACASAAKSMLSRVPDVNGSKQAAAMLVLSGVGDAKKLNDEVISVGGARGYSTFFGYYILAAKALAGDFVGALDDIKSYWGSMLDMGATTFWEDFNLDWVEDSAPIDEIVPEGKNDIHGDFGGYCYKNFRHSLCHGWSSGPCPYITHYVLGIRTVSHDTYEIKPELSYLDWARGTYPTPYGVIEVSVSKNADGTQKVDIKAPKEIKVIK